MIAKQYCIALPADYDMAIIRKRVAEKGSTFDTFPGLCFKMFLIQERGIFGAVGNSYAPFYLWADTESLWNFAAGKGFAGIIESFGRPAINTWLSMACSMQSNLDPVALRFAVIDETPIAPGVDLEHFRQEMIAAGEAAVDDEDGPAISMSAVDPTTWRLLTFSAYSHLPLEESFPPTAGRYEVLHVSGPGLVEQLRQIKSR